MTAPDEQPTIPPTHDSLDAVIGDYLQQVEGGTAPDRESLLADHPALADQLREFFADYDRIGRRAAELRLIGDPNQTVGAAERPAEPRRVRYFGDYELLEEIARGGMGVVYRARQVSLDRIVALKMILAGQFAGPTDVQRFRLEAQAAANLQHPGIVAIYEVGEHEGQHFFSMEYLEGSSLAALVRANPLAPARAARYLAAVARAIHHAHNKGILHRDLKPSNVLLDRADMPHVTDFGLAKRIERGSELTATGAVLGTPSYMPPEQASANRGALSPASDVYSLGAILYELLTGRPPFRAENPVDTVLQVIHESPVAPRLLNSALPRDLETICLKCLEKEPARRYASAEALADDLDRWLRGEPIRARPVGAVERGWRWCRRNPVVAGLTAAVATSLLAGTSVSIYYALEAGQRAEQANTNAREAREKTTMANAALERLKRLSYAQSIALARAECEANNIERALLTLDACPTELRHWEWSYLKRLCQGELRSLDNQSRNLGALGYRPDGQVLAGGGGMIGFGPFLGDQELVLWDTISGQPLKPFRSGTHHGAITGLAWSADGTRLALGLWCMDDARDVVVAGGKGDETRAGRVEIWDVTRGKRLHTLLGHHSFVNGVAWSADGTKVASAGSDRTAQVWDARTGKLLFRLEGHRGQIRTIVFSPKGKLLATGGEGALNNSSSQTPDDMGEVKLWDLESGREKFSCAGHPLGVLSVAFSPDSAVLASASRDRTVKLWDTRTGELLRTLFGHTDDVTAVAFSSTSNILATASADRSIRVWQRADGRPLRVLRGHTIPVRALAFHPDGRRLASCANSHRGVEVKIWDVTATPEVTVCAAVASRVQQLELSPDGRRVATLLQMQGNEHSQWRVFDATSGKALFTFQADQWTDGLRFSSDSKRLITLQGSDPAIIKTFDATNGREISSVSLPHKIGRRAPLSGVATALSRNGEWAATEDLLNKTIVLRNCADAKEVKRFALGVEADAVHLLFSADRRRLAAICDRRFPDEPRQWRTVHITVWDTESGAVIMTVNPTDLHAQSWRTQFSPDGALLAMADDDRRVRLWHVDQQRSFEWEIGPDCWGVRFSRDSRRLVTVHAENKRPHMRVWDIATRRELFALTDFAEGFPSADGSDDVVFAADGRRLFTCGDGTLKVWDATQGQLLLTLRPAFSPIRLSLDETRLVAGGPQGATLIWFAPGR
jgi:WD40 repeat protein/serine/threonine protein kinase